MSKTKSISELITELERENDRLKTLQKHFDAMCRSEFGFDVDTIHEKLEKAAILERKTAERQGQEIAPKISEI